MATVLHRTDKPQENPFQGWQEDDDGFRIHLTPGLTASKAATEFRTAVQGYTLP